MAGRIKFICLMLGLTPLLCAQTAPDLAKILERLDRLEQENRMLSEQVRALQAQLGTPAPPPPTVEERLDVHENRIEEQAQTKVEASQKFPIRLTGTLLFNAFLNSKQSGGADYPVVASPTGVGHSGASVRQTIIGLEFNGPQAIWGGKVSGNVYMDFFTGAAPAASTFHLRTTNFAIDWKDRAIVAGLEKPIFNPREPASLAQVGVSPLTGAGNLWFWLPQIRFEQEVHFTPTTGFRAQVGALQTREINPISGTAALETARPSFEGRVNFFRRLNEERRFEFAAGFHTSTTHAGGFNVPSNLYSFDWFANPWKRVEFSGAFYSGQNVAHLGSGTRQGFAISGTTATAIGSVGGWGQLTLHTLPRLDFHFFTGQVDDQNNQMQKGSIGKNLLYGGNAYFRIAPNVLMGLEATQVRTMYIGQGVRINNHYDLALGYLF